MPGVYGASKAGVGHFSDSLRCDLLGTGVRISEICPGRGETQLYRTTVGKENARTELYDGYDPIRPEDIAALIMAALNMPRNVDVSRMEVFPTSQAVGGSRIVKTTRTRLSSYGDIGQPGSRAVAAGTLGPLRESVSAGTATDQPTESGQPSPTPPGSGRRQAPP